MPRKIIPVVDHTGLTNLKLETGATNDEFDMITLYHNTTPIKISKDEWALQQRPTFKAKESNIAGADIGRLVYTLFNGTDDARVYRVIDYTLYGNILGPIDLEYGRPWPNQDETDYDGVGDNGTFSGGTGHAISDQISLGSLGLVLVDAVDGGGAVTQFTTQTQNGWVKVGDSQGQTFTTGSGTGFSMTFQKNNIDALAVPESLPTLMMYDEPNNDGYIIFPGLGSTWTGYIMGLTGTPVSDPDCPGINGKAICRGAAQLNGRLYVGTSDGSIYNSAIDDWTSWDATDFITAERETDAQLYLTKHHDHIVSFNTKGIEFFYDAGLAPNSPLQRRQDIYHRISCSCPNAFVEVGDIIYFIGEEFNGDKKLYKLESFQVIPISPVNLDFILNRVHTLPSWFDTSYNKDLTGTSLNFDIVCASLYGPQIGHNIIITITNKTQNYAMYGTFVLHLETGILSRWYTGGSPGDVGTGSWLTAMWGPAAKGLPIVGTSQYMQNNSKHRTLAIFSNGEVGAMEEHPDGDLEDVSVTTAAPCFFTTNPDDLDTQNRKRYSKISLLHLPKADSNVDPANFTLSWIDLETLELRGYDIDSFPTGRTIDTSKPRAVFHRCGISRQRVYRGDLTPGKKQIIKGLEIDYDVLSN